MPKNKFVGIHFVADNIGPNFNHFVAAWVAFKATKIYEIMQNNGHFAVKGLSKVTTFGTNAKSMQLSLVTYILYCTVSN